jgi:2-dehydro-3-deoxyphosphooctonate aldolase (KDO 8-P synthase)
MKNVIDKARAAAREGPARHSFMACERGASFGYNNLVSDMRSLAIMRETGAPGGVRRHPQRCSCRAGRAPVGRPARVRAGAGARGRGRGRGRPVHGNPPRSGQGLSDGPNAVPLKHMKALLEHLVALDRVVKQQPAARKRLLLLNCHHGRCPPT